MKPNLERRRTAISLILKVLNGRHDWTRTSDLFRVKEALYPTELRACNATIRSLSASAWREKMRVCSLVSHDVPSVSDGVRLFAGIACRRFGRNANAHSDDKPRSPASCLCTGPA